MARGIALSREEIARSFNNEDLWDRYPPVMTTKEVAAMLGKSPTTIYFWIAERRLDGCFKKRGKGHMFWRDRVIDRMFNGPDWPED
jgi:hypothetical protein